MGAIYLVRHGQASFGSPDYDRLSDVGHEQSRILGAALRARLEKVDAVWMGRMKRHRQTAEACLGTMGLAAAPSPALHAGFDEFAHEEVLERYEPRYRDRAVLAADISKTPSPGRAFQAIFARAVARWVAGEHDDEYAEPFRAFAARVTAAVRELAAAMGPGQVGLVFTSGGPISVIAGQLLGLEGARALELQWTLVNCGVTKVMTGTTGPKPLVLSSLNDHAPFDGSRRELLTYR